MEDPRSNPRNQIRYSLSELCFVTIAAVISGFNEWNEIALFGKEKIDWLRKFFPYEKGSPCNTTLIRFFAKLDPDQFSYFFSEWIASLNELSSGQVVAIDGKTLRGSVDKAHDKAAIHMITAFVSEQQLFLGQLATEQKSNEITAIPQLLDMIAIKNCIVTIDAMGCQKEIAKNILTKEADYILQVKGNQKGLLEQIEKLFQIAPIANSHTSHDLEHGRIEQRTADIITDFTHLDDCSDWLGLKTLIRIQSQRESKSTGKKEKSVRYYISSREDGAKAFNHNIRSHWAIENKLHWSLDVTFKEDENKKRIGNSAFNFNLISKVALTIINQYQNKKLSKKNKRSKAALSDTFREQLLDI